MITMIDDNHNSQLRHMQAHVRQFQRVRLPEAVIGVHHAVMAEGDIHAFGHQPGT
jgi:hypothetical protein